MYGPEVRQEVGPNGVGRKLFRYRLVAQRPGVLPLDSVWRLTVFDPATARYVALRPTLQLRIRAGGPAAADYPVAADPFYAPAIARADATLQPLDVYRQVRRYATILLAALFGLAAAGWWQSRRNA